jgi:hypothetical protein
VGVEVEVVMTVVEVVVAVVIDDGKTTRNANPTMKC